MGLASGVVLEHATAAGICGATTDHRLAVALSHSEGAAEHSTIVDGWV